MATLAELDRLRQLAGAQLPTEAHPTGEPYTDEQLQVVLEHLPPCPRHPGRLDLYLAAALLWEDKALVRDLEQTTTGGDGPLVTGVSQAGASIAYARPTKLGTVVTAPNDPTAMRVLAERLRKRSCCWSRWRSADVTPSQVVLPGDNTVREWDGGDSMYSAGRPVVLDPATNPDRAINLPELES